MTLPCNVAVRAALARDHAGYSLTDEAAIRALSLAEDRHFWHRARNQFIAGRLGRLGLRPPARVLELGCGGGCVSANLWRLGYTVTGVDGHLPRVLEAAARAPGARFIVEDLSREGVLDDQAGADAVALFDVLEHLTDPGAALRSALRLARPGGWVVGTVPALQWLWSDADRLAGHHLRYERPALEGLLGAIPGADEVEVVPFNRLLVPLLWLQRRAAAGPEPAESAAAYLRVPWAPVNGAMHLLLRAEDRLAGLLPRLLPGASLWFALRRAETQPRRFSTPPLERSFKGL